MTDRGPFPVEVSSRPEPTRSTSRRGFFKVATETIASISFAVTVEGELRQIRGGCFDLALV